MKASDPVVSCKDCFEVMIVTCNSRFVDIIGFSVKSSRVCRPRGKVVTSENFEVLEIAIRLDSVDSIAEPDERKKVVSLALKGIRTYVRTRDEKIQVQSRLYSVPLTFLFCARFPHARSLYHVPLYRQISVRTVHRLCSRFKTKIIRQHHLNHHQPSISNFIYESSQKNPLDRHNLPAEQQ